MKERTFVIPIYGGNLTIVYGKKLKKFKKQHNLTSIDGYDGFFFSNDEDYYIVLRCKDPSIIAHESLHFVGELLANRNISYSNNNDEPFCYLLGWTVGKANRVIGI